MALSPNFNKRFFPSYGQIHQKILSEHKKQHVQKLSHLQSKIQTMKQAFNLQEEHAEIRRKLLDNYNSSNHQYLKSIVQSLTDGQEKLQKQKESYLMNIGSSGSGYGNASSNAYSLNYCVDDDMQEDNHYENHLKFKKQVLQRDLFQNINYKPDKKKHHDEEYIFKNLYNPRPATAYELGIHDKLKVRKPLKKNYLPSENTKEFKENVKQLRRKCQTPLNSRKMDLRSFNKSKQTDLKNKRYGAQAVTKKCMRKSTSQDQFTQQHEICQKNTKILKDSFGKYLRELSSTNIIKWRVLGGERERQRDLISMSMNSAGIRSSIANHVHQDRASSESHKGDFVLNFQGTKQMKLPDNK